MLAATLLMLLAGYTGSRFSRGEGAVFLLLYAAYLAALGALNLPPPFAVAAL